MAGKPATNAMLAKVEEAGGEAAILTRIAAGETITHIAKGFGVHLSTLSGWLNRTPDNKAAVTRAREEAAHALAEEALGDARAVDEDNHKSKSVKIKALQWHAGKLNRAVYGDTPLVAVQVNVGDIMLDALKQTPPAVPQHLVVEAQKDSDNQTE